MEKCATTPGGDSPERVVTGEPSDDQAGENPSFRAVAPGRINLIGEHIDYLGGKVMPVAIDRHIVIEAMGHPGDYCEIQSEVGKEQRTARIDFSEGERRETEEERWLNYNRKSVV